MEKRLFHVDVYMPNWCIRSAQRLHRNLCSVEFSHHFCKQCINTEDCKHFIDVRKLREIILSTSKSSNPINVFEVEVTKINNENVCSYKITKYVFRAKYDDSRDVSIVIIPQTRGMSGHMHAFIKTAWVNSKTDTHTTLKTNKYDVAL